MKLPKSTRRLCPYCKKHTEQTVKQEKNRGLNKNHTMSHGARAQKRGKAGAGNSGRFSRPPIAKWKMTGKKLTKKTDFRYTCTVCKKISVQSSGIRAKKVELI